MNRKIFLLISAVVLSLNAFSQYSISSSVFDQTNGGAMEGVGVRLMAAKDSAYISGAQTDDKGEFSLTKIPDGRYIVEVSFIGYVTQSVTVTLAGKNVALKAFNLVEDARMLKEVVVQGTAAQMTVKGDTLEYNAAAFKTNENAVVEDLLKKLPGVEITADGKITVNGEEIKNIRVDGKKFFVGDPEMATKNIPADAIEKIQVLDQKSTMAQLTGFEDDDTERIINLTFKKNRKKGQFGNITAGAGADVDDGEFRYDINGFLNMINGDYQQTLTAGGNNVNTSRSSRGRGGFNMNTGITENQNLGYNLSGVVNPKLTIGGDVSGSHTRNTQDNETKRTTYLDTVTYYNNSKNFNVNNMWRTNVRFEADWKPDSANTFIFRPDFNISKTYIDNSNDFSYLTASDTTSLGRTTNHGESTTYGANLRTIYSHKFDKKGRTFSAQITFGFTQTDRENINIQTNKYLTDNNINQKTNNSSSRQNFDVRLSWVEPLWSVNNLLEIVARFGGNFNQSHKNQYRLDSLNNYSIFDSEYSNDFRTNFFTEGFELNYRFTQKLYNLTAGIKVEPSQTYSYGTREFSNSVVNFAPNFRFQYNFEKRKFVRINYTGRTQQPTIDQMQPVKDNSDLMSETVGNPNLKPAFAHNFRLFYSAFNQNTFSSFSAMMFANLTQNALLNNTIYDATGKRLSQTVNGQKQLPFSSGANVNFNTPLVKKFLQFNTNTNVNFNKQYGYNDNEHKDINTDSISQNFLPLGYLSKSQRFGVGERISLTFTNNFMEIGANGGLQYSNSRSNMNAQSNTETYDWSAGGSVLFRLPWGFTLSSDINYTTRNGYSADFDQKEVIWNASLDKDLFKGAAVVTLKAFDILQQRLNIRQTIGDNYIQNTSYNTLQSYVMLSFSYKFNRFAGMSSSEASRYSQPQQDNRFGLPAGMPPMGGGRQPR
ncbi:MAG: TonB-dependent receptor [Paludibacter sp.]|nr:TonB-dependent receptor [Paludibacter sp.]